MFSYGVTMLILLVEADGADSPQVGGVQVPNQQTLAPVAQLARISQLVTSVTFQRWLQQTL